MSTHVMIARSAALAAALAAALGLCTTAAAGQTPAPPTPTDSDVVASKAAPDNFEDLLQRVRILERKLELKQEEDEAKAKATATIAIGDGVAFRSPDGALQLKLKGYFQEDGRLYQGQLHAGTSTFLLRRVRPVFEATALGRYTVRIMPDFGNGQTVLQDAYVDAMFAPWLGLRFGKFKPPVGLERLQSATSIMFVERALPTALVPNRDLGVQLQGALGDAVLSYAVGAFNGVVDGANGDNDGDNDKDLEARVFVQPFRTTAIEPLSGSGLGLAVTRGNVHGSATGPALPSFSSPGQLAFFRYRADGKPTGTAYASGEHVRFVPQGWYFYRSLSVLGEYAISRQAVRLDTSALTLSTRAWQLSAAYALTGEDAGAKGVRPRSIFDPTKGTWGAFELTARVHGLKLDDAAFPLVADPTASARSAAAWAAGANWYLNPNVKLVVDYERTRFRAGSKTGDRATEKALMTRIQFSF